MTHPDPASPPVVAFSLTTGDGVSLQGDVWEPGEPPGAVVLFVHGFGEHRRRHDRLALALCARNIGVVRCDLRGHGESGGARGDAPSYGYLLDDLDLLWNWTKQRYPTLPMGLYGHSFGGQLAVNWLVERRADSVVTLALSSPWFRLRKQPRHVKRWLLGVASRCWPALMIPTGIRAQHLASDLQSISAYRQDPLVVKRISLRMAAAAIEQGERALQAAGRLNLPCLLVHGGADQITCPCTSREFADAAPQVTLEIWEHLAHEMHFESQGGAVVARLADWFTAHFSEVRSGQLSAIEPGSRPR